VSTPRRIVAAFIPNVAADVKDKIVPNKSNS